MSFFLLMIVVRFCYFLFKVRYESLQLIDFKGNLEVDYYLTLL